MKKMTRWGIGPLFGILTSLYSGVVYCIDSYFPNSFEFTGRKEVALFLMILGFCLFIYPAITIDKYFNNRLLRTKGLYSICRHPIYGAWILLIIPGIVLWWGSLIGFTIPLVAYVIFTSFIYKEESYLLRKFGSEYIDYSLRINAIFPKFNNIQL
jgi:protein-S-isoprenylcysteine O-methyltransferase Ste14